MAALGRPAYINLGRPGELGPDRSAPTMERRTHAVLDAAFAAGVRYVDTARSYGRAEEFLASWLAARAIEPGAVTVGSKWGYRYTGGWRMDAAVQETKEHSLAMFRRQQAESSALLGEHLRLYQVHSATLDSGVLDDVELLRALAELPRTGVAVGLTVSGARQGDVVRRALDVEVDGTNPFTSVQATWNLLEPSAAPALAEAHRRGWGVIVKEVLANGRLTAAAGEGDAPTDAHALAVRTGVPVEVLAFAVALHQPWADVVLSGAVQPDQLAAGLGALHVTPLDEDGERLAGMAQPPDEYWRRRSELPWR